MTQHTHLPEQEMQPQPRIEVSNCNHREGGDQSYMRFHRIDENRSKCPVLLNAAHQIGLCCVNIDGIRIVLPIIDIHLQSLTGWNFTEAKV